MLHSVLLIYHVCAVFLRIISIPLKYRQSPKLLSVILYTRYQDDQTGFSSPEQYYSHHRGANVTQVLERMDEDNGTEVYSQLFSGHVERVFSYLHGPVKHCKRFVPKSLRREQMTHIISIRERDPTKEHGAKNASRHAVYIQIRQLQHIKESILNPSECDGNIQIMASSPRKQLLSLLPTLDETHSI